MKGSEKSDVGMLLGEEELLNFLFPPSKQYSRATARLYLLADYGPLVDGALRGGYQRSHVLSDQELEEMIRQSEREDILRIYMGDKVLRPDEQEDVLSKVPLKLKEKLYPSKETKHLYAAKVLDMLQGLHKDENGNYKFDDIQKAVQKERLRRLEEARQMFPPTKHGKAHQSSKGILSLEPNKTSTLDIFRGQIRDQDVRAHFIYEVTPDYLQIFRHTSGMLSKHAYAIADYEEMSNPALTQNVRLLRAAKPVRMMQPRNCSHTDFQLYQVEGRADWDNTCCVAGTETGSRISKK